MDRTERNRLVTENLPLVGYLVSDVCARATHLSREDLAQVGSLALVTAAGSFDASLGVPFGAYARTRIMGAFADEMRAGDWASRGTRKRIREATAVQETLTASLGRTPTIDEVASALGVDRASAQSVLADASRVVTTIDETVHDTIRSETPAPGDGMLEDERARYLRAAVAALPERMRLIVTAVYFDGRTVGEVADELGITHSAVSQQRSEAMRLLHDALATHYADDPEAQPELRSRTTESRRSAYLAQVAAAAAVGSVGDLSRAAAVVSTPAFPPAAAVAPVRRLPFVAA